MCDEEPPRPKTKNTMNTKNKTNGGTIQKLTVAAKTEDASSIDGVLMMNTNFEVVNIGEFDILLTDIKGEAIREMEIDGAKHLSPATESSSSNTTTLNGITFGDYSRILVRAVLSAKGKSVNAVMLVDTGSPYTFLTGETFNALNIDLENQPDDQAFVLINGQRAKAHLSKAHFEDVNVLGTNFLDYCEVNINYPRKTARITIVPV